jgi:hypothetical protein
VADGVASKEMKYISEYDALENGFNSDKRLSLKIGINTI